MNRLDRDMFYRGFRKKLKSALQPEEAERIWRDAGVEYARMLSDDPLLKQENGAMVIPAVAMYRTLAANGLDAERLLSEYGRDMGIKLAGIVRVITGIPGLPRLIWKKAGNLADSMSSEKKGYKRRLVSDPPAMYGVDILSCPYHELAKQLGEERAVMCICCMDKEYSQGFRMIRYDRNSALTEGAQCCEYRLRFDKDKK